MNRNLMKVLLVTVICCVSHSASRAQISVAPTTNRVGAATISGSTTEGISYQGGPVMLTPHNMYYVWYGNWSGNSALTILPSLALGLNGSPYFATNTTYSNSTPQNINTSVSMSSQTFDNYSQGTSLSLGAVQSVVSSAISRGAFPVDPNGVYFVLTSADVDQFNVLLTEPRSGSATTTADGTRTPTCSARTSSLPSLAMPTAASAAVLSPTSA